jgi:hypothetical protein
MEEYSPPTKKSKRKPNYLPRELPIKFMMNTSTKSLGKIFQILPMSFSRSCAFE